MVKKTEFVNFFSSAVIFRIYFKLEKTLITLPINNKFILIIVKKIILLQFV